MLSGNTDYWAILIFTNNSESQFLESNNKDKANTKTMLKGTLYIIIQQKVF